MHDDELLSLRLYADNHPEVQEPTWRQVLHALLGLDGRESTLICLEAPNGITLMIGGGNEGRYLVDYLVDPETQQNYVLTNPALAGPAVKICCGGQTAEHPPHWAVDLGLVLDAAHHFCGTGGIAPHLTWQEDRRGGDLEVDLPGSGTLRQLLHAGPASGPEKTDGARHFAGFAASKRAKSVAPSGLAGKSGGRSCKS